MKYTCKAPGDTGGLTIYYVTKVIQNVITSSHSYPGLDIDISHAPVLAMCNIRFFLKGDFIFLTIREFIFKELRNNPFLCTNYRINYVE